MSSYSFGSQQFSGSNSTTTTGALATNITYSESATISSYNVFNNHLPQHTYLSEIELSILRSQVPININETEEITVLGQKGIWVNKGEVSNWRGTLPINEYPINEDESPEVISKRALQNLTYIQELAVRYLKPPTPRPPGEIIIQQESNIPTAPAPPLVIRQQPARPTTPEPLVIRESPPKLPEPVGRKVITISGKRLPPPPRKIIIERLAPLPNKPQPIIVERWLPYRQIKRRVIFKKSSESEPVLIKPKNVIIQWEAPSVSIKKDFKYLGIVRADPAEYVQRYGTTLKEARDLPDFVLNIKQPQGVVLAAEYQFNQVFELEGEVEALKLVDLDKEGLSEYKNQLRNLDSKWERSNNEFNRPNEFTYAYLIKQQEQNIAEVIRNIFVPVEKDQNQSLSLDEAEKLLDKLNSRLGRKWEEDDVRDFFESIEINQDGKISLNEFIQAFKNIL